MLEEGVLNSGARKGPYFLCAKILLMQLSYKEFLIVIAVVITAAMAFFVLLRRPRNPINIFFFLGCVNIIVWELGIIIFRTFASMSSVLFWGQFIHFAALLIPLCFLLSFLFFPNGQFKKSASWISIIITLLTLVWGWLVFSPEYISGLTFVSGVRGLQYEPLFLLYSLHLALIFFACLVVLGIGYVKSTGALKAQYLYMFLGIIFASVIGIFLNLILVGFGDFRFNWLGPLSPIVMMAFIAYAIVTHRLFDIRVIIRRTVVFAGLSLFALVSYATIVFGVTELLGGAVGTSFSLAQFVPNMLAVLVIAYGFDPIRRWLSIRTDKWLFKGEYDSDELLGRLSTTLTNAVDLNDAVKGMMTVVTKEMRLAKGAAFLVQPAEEKGEFELKQLVEIGYENKTHLELLEHDPLIRFFSGNDAKAGEYAGLIVADELERKFEEGHYAHDKKQLTSDFIGRMHRLDGAVAMPLFITRREPVPTPPGTPTKYNEVETFIGVLVFGEKQSADSFTDRDLKLLGIIASQTAGAVEKSRLFEEDQLKSEFVAVASHELLTPTAAMEGYLSMILDEGLGKVDKQARTYLETVYSESKRLASLVKDLLNVSRIERGKIVVSLESIALDESINQVLASLKFRAAERKIEIKFDKAAAKDVKVMVDKDKLTEVFMNLVGNAIKYTPEGGNAEITVEIKGKMAVVSVKDNGIGLKPEDATHLFSKFFRASNSDQTGQGGTGLGLYITKSIIEMMGGTITVESHLGKGSTFTFTLPLAK